MAMDTNTGELKSIEEILVERGTIPKDWPIFAVGEILEIKGQKMRIRKITKKDIILRSVKLDNDEDIRPEAAVLVVDKTEQLQDKLKELSNEG